MKSALSPITTALEPAATQAAREDELANLVAHGISEMKAAELPAKLKPGQHVVDQLEWGEEVLRRSRPGTVHNPPGLLVSFIECNLSPPTCFESSRMRRLREAAEREKAERRTKLVMLEFEYEKYRRQEVERFLEDELPGDEYKRLFAAKKQQFAETYRSLALNPGSLAEMAHAGVRSEIMTRLALQSFE